MPLAIVIVSPTLLWFLKSRRLLLRITVVISSSGFIKLPPLRVIRNLSLDQTFFLLNGLFPIYFLWFHRPSRLLSNCLTRCCSLPSKYIASRTNPELVDPSYVITQLNSGKRLSLLKLQIDISGWDIWLKHDKDESQYLTARYGCMKFPYEIKNDNNIDQDCYGLPSIWVGKCANLAQTSEVNCFTSDCKSCQIDSSFWHYWFWTLS